MPAWGVSGQIGSAVIFLGTQERGALGSSPVPLVCAGISFLANRSLQCWELPLDAAFSLAELRHTPPPKAHRCRRYYAGNIVTLTFGALSINDVLAAVVTLLFYEAVSAAFYRSPTRPLRLWMANFFKAGLTAALLADAVKLGG